jgi:hypothetical protein
MFVLNVARMPHERTGLVSHALGRRGRPTVHLCKVAAVIAERT